MLKALVAAAALACSSGVSGALVTVQLHESACTSAQLAPPADVVRDARRAVLLHWRPEESRLWCLWVAQLGAESQWKQGAVSPAGAAGIAQLMPATARQYEARLGVEWLDDRRELVSSADTPLGRWVNMQAGAVLMRDLTHLWRAPRSAWCRYQLAAASYNAGQGNILEAQTRAGGARCWDRIGSELSAVTGRHAAETLGYVSRIERWGDRLMGPALAAELRELQ